MRTRLSFGTNRRALVVFLVALASLNGKCDDESRDAKGGDASPEGDTDTCDCPEVDGASADGLTAALGLCDGDGLSNAEIHYSSEEGYQGIAVKERLGDNGCLVAKHGCMMVMLSTGPVDQQNPNLGEDMGDDDAKAELDPQPGYQGDEETTSAIQKACDVVQLALELDVPDWAYGLSFDFLFASSEYPEWLGQGYNDTFYAILEDPAQNGGVTTNIAFDDNGNEIEVDSMFFENEEHPCSEQGSSWAVDIDDGAGSTGWLRTKWPVTNMASIRLTFSIHDEGDCIYDSMVLIDRFEWHDSMPTGGTRPVVE